MNEPITVSVSCTTYNHAPYIRKCFEGFLMQKTTFSFEVLVHDDASTDGTREIIEEYVVKYPNLFFPIYQTKNQYSKGVRGIMAKFNFSRCRGKYIALCEGDDYWQDPMKLQKQVDFMEQNPDFSGIHHKVLYVDKEGSLLGESDRVLSDYFIASYEDLVQGNMIHTCSFLFNTKSLKYQGEYIWKLSHDFHDIYLFLSVALSGKIKYSDEVMATYRRGVGVMQAYTKKGLLDEADRYLNFFIDTWDLTTQQKAYTYLRLSTVFLSYAEILAEERDTTRAKVLIKKFWQAFFKYKQNIRFRKNKRLTIKFRKIIKVYLFTFLPRLANRIIIYRSKYSHTI